jgi:di/tricarboxylate transporter
VNTLLAKNGLAGQEWRIWSANLLAHLLVALGAYLAFGGLRLLRSGRSAEAEHVVSSLTRRHWATIAVTTVWMVLAVVLRVNVGLSAFAAGTLLVLLRVADEQEAMRTIPFDVLFMVTGVTMLIAIVETTGGLTLFTGLIARVASPATLNAVIAFVTGVISTYSSTSGVVLPAFLPMIPGLVRQVGGGDPLGVAISINVGSALVDVSPLSTLGALCLAAMVDRSNARRLFRQLMIWGLSMTIVGAVVCGIFANAYARL